MAENDIENEPSEVVERRLDGSNDGRTERAAENMTLTGISNRVNELENDLAESLDVIGDLAYRLRCIEDLLGIFAATIEQAQGGKYNLERVPNWMVTK